VFGTSVVVLIMNGRPSNTMRLLKVAAVNISGALVGDSDGTLLGVVVGKGLMDGAFVGIFVTVGIGDIVGEEDGASETVGCMDIVGEWLGRGLAVGFAEGSTVGSKLTVGLAVSIKGTDVGMLESPSAVTLGAGDIVGSCADATCTIARSTSNTFHRIELVRRVFDSPFR
jgi:hypothetical protein